MTIGSRDELFEALGNGDVARLVGTEEAEWLDFKRDAYPLDLPKGKRDLCADLAAFANQRGGVIVLGVRTERQGDVSSEAAVEIRPLASGLVTAERVQKIVAEHVKPLLRVTVREYPVGEQVVVTISVDRGADRDLPFMVDRVGGEQDKDLPHAFGWPTRHGTDTSWEPLSRIQQLVSNGLRLDSAAAPEVPIGRDDVVAQDALLAELEGWSDNPRLLIRALPDTSTEIRDFYGSFSTRFRNWQPLRQSGFGLGLEYRDVTVSDGQMVASTSRRFVAVGRSGALTAAANGTDEFLGWAGGRGETLVISPWVLTEFILEAVRFTYEALMPATNVTSWTFTLELTGLTGGRPVVLLPKPVRPTQFWGPYPDAIAERVARTVKASGDAGRDAFELVAEVYGAGFHLGRDQVPFSQDERIVPDHFRQT